MSSFLKVENLVKNFPVHGGFFGREIATVKAVQGVSFDLKKGQTLGLVGESGCGKSTLGRCILRLIEPSSGKISFNGTDVTAASASEMRALRRKMQIVFQDPFASLNPRMTIGAILKEPLLIHDLFSSEKDRMDRVLQLLELVGLRKDVLTRYPHEFSGGQRQRVGIARALAVEPELIICDEPVSALDVSIQAQVINLLMELQEKLGLSYIFIAHDLKVVEYISDEVAVMYLGKIVEHSSATEIYRNPLHPYTQALLSSIPIPDPKRRGEKKVLVGDIPSPISPPTGCHFHPRCPIASKECAEIAPQLENKAPHHSARCIKI
jgi:oligopeptide transport system ATP-binding protein